MDILRAAPLSANQQVSHSCPMSCPCHVTLDLPRKCAPPPRSPYIRQTEDKIRDLILSRHDIRTVVEVHICAVNLV
jgi:hypothetical protein